MKIRNTLLTLVTTTLIFSGVTSGKWSANINIQDFRNYDGVIDNVFTWDNTLFDNQNQTQDSLVDMEKISKEIQKQKYEEAEKLRKEQEAKAEVKAEAKKSKGTNLGQFKITAYDLSVQSCGKKMNHPYYGITASGVSLKGKSRAGAMAVAVDPRVIPLGSKLYIEFPAPYSSYTGIYTAVDTGGAIKGKKIDLFYGDFSSEKTHQSVWDFGVRYGNVTLVK